MTRRARRIEREYQAAKAEIEAWLRLSQPGEAAPGDALEPEPESRYWYDRAVREQWPTKVQYQIVHGRQGPSPLRCEACGWPLPVLPPGRLPGSDDKMEIQCGKPQCWARYVAKAGLLAEHGHLEGWTPPAPHPPRLTWRDILGPVALALGFVGVVGASAMGFAYAAHEAEVRNAAPAPAAAQASPVSGISEFYAKLVAPAGFTADHAGKYLIMCPRDSLYMVDGVPSGSAPVLRAEEEMGLPLRHGQMLFVVPLDGKQEDCMVDRFVDGVP